MLTQSELRQELYYDVNSGLFTRIKSNHHSVMVGDIAGSLNTHGYVGIKVFGKLYLAHRLAYLYMLGETPDEVDHINHIRADNRWVNLRDVTRSENCKNNSKRKDNASGVTGVHWKKRDSRWVAQIRVDKETLWLGQFVKFSDAVDARKNAEVLYGFHENHGKEGL